MFPEHINPRVFDAQFFRLSRTDAIAMDPQQRHLLEVVYECLENAGLSMEKLDGAKVWLLRRFLCCWYVRYFLMTPESFD